jgi:ribosome-associated heat shock protein Hsp15
MRSTIITSNPDCVRLDKWLWAARFFKSRSLAAEAAQGGKVHIGGNRVKPAREIRVGEQLSIRRGPYEWVITVKGLAERRGPAKEAMLLYEETRESVANREAARAQIEAEAALFSRPGGRPTKRDRRELERLKGE